jgi:hypothetical protein
MKNPRIICASLVCLAFALGIFVGIWAEWSTWREGGAQLIVYQVEPYNQANVMVKQGDQINLLHPDGTSTGLQMKFLGGDSPCTNGNGDDHCLVGASKTGGQFLFSCTSTDGTGDQCPDPGTQQQPTNPPPNPNPKYTLVKDIFYDAKHAIGLRVDVMDLNLQQYREHLPQSHPAPTAAVGAYAYVDCNDTTLRTEVVPQQPSGAADSSISISAGKTMYWTSHDVLTLTPPSGLCPAGVQTLSSNNVSYCVVGGQGTYSYTATLNNCPAGSGAETIIVTP